MSRPVTVRGHFAGGTFVSDGPLPDTEGTAELVITPLVPAEPGPRKTLLDIIGKYPKPMTLGADRNHATRTASRVGRTVI